MKAFFGPALLAIGGNLAHAVVPDTNPYWPMANRSADAVIAQDFAQEMVNPSASVFWLAWAATSPHSHAAKTPELRARLTQILEKVADDLHQPKATESDFWSLLPLLESINLIKADRAYPGELLTKWKEALRLPVELLYHQYGPAPGVDSANAAGSYPNSDAQYCAIMALANEVYGDERYIVSARLFVASLGQNLVSPLGAWYYYKHSVPVPLYHGFELIFLGRYYQVTLDQNAAGQIRKTRDYYPKVFTTPNAVEYSSAAWWKQGWDPIGGPYHAVELAAWICGDGENRWFADVRAQTYQPFYWEVYCGEAWDNGRAHRQPAIPPSRQFLVEDRSIAGFRGRNEGYSFVGCRGRFGMSVGGCMVDDGGYSGYLQLARLALTTAQSSAEPYYQSLRMVADPSVDVPGEQLLGQDYAALRVKFIPQVEAHPSGAAKDWESTEIWLFTPTGMLVSFRATALQDRPAGLPQGIMRLGPLSSEVKISGGRLSIGKLEGLLLDCDDFDPQLTKGPVDLNGTEARYEVRLSLRNPPAAIKKGDSWSYALAFFPTKEQNGSVKYLSADRLLMTIGARVFQIDGNGGSLPLKVSLVTSNEAK